MRALICFLALAAFPVCAAAQDKAASSPWVEAEGRITLKSAGIGFPAAPGGLKVTRTQDFSHEGEGLDTAVRYASPDGAVWATAYVFYPGLPHAGLAAVATDDAIRRGSKTSVEGGEVRIVQAGGKEGAAIRRDYRNYNEGQASSAAFAKTGRWLVKLRVSGPPERAREVDAAMNALLAGLRSSEPIHTAAPLSVKDCSGADGSADARRLAHPAGAEVAAFGFLGTLDGGGIEATDKGTGKPTILPSRVPREFCRVRSAAIGERVVLRGLGGGSGIDGRTRLVVILGDGGQMLELVEAPNLGRHVLLHHGIGETTVLSTWSAVPSDAQVAAILSGKDKDALHILAPVKLRPGKGAEMHLPSSPEKDGAPRT